MIIQNIIGNQFINTFENEDRDLKYIISLFFPESGFVINSSMGFSREFKSSKKMAFKNEDDNDDNIIEFYQHSNSIMTPFMDRSIQSYIARTEINQHTQISIREVVISQPNQTSKFSLWLKIPIMKYIPTNYKENI